MRSARRKTLVIGAGVSWRGDTSTLRRRFARAQAGAGVRSLRWHDLRHTYGSLLAADGINLVSIKDAMGHSALATTGRYLHARPASEQAARFTRAFQPAVAAPDSATTNGAMGSAKSVSDGAGDGAGFG